MKKIVLSFSLIGILLFSLTITSTCFCAIKKPIIKKKSTPEKLLSKAYKKQQIGKYRKAIKIYNKIIEIEPKFNQVYINLGFCFRKIGEYKKAIKNYKKAIKIDPKSTKPYMALGRIYIKVGEFDKANLIQKKLKEIQPREANKLLKEINSHKVKK